MPGRPKPLTALVTGASGFIGSNLVDRLLADGMQVKCLVRRASNLTWLQNRPVSFVTGDYRDAASLTAAVAGADLVFHVAGATRARDRAGYFQGNYEATCNLLKACETHAPARQKFIFVSSLAAAGPSAGSPLTEDEIPRPVSAYGASKLAAEQAVLAYSRSRPAVVIRPPAVYGPRDKDTHLLIKNISRGLHVIPGTGLQKVSLVHVHDLVHGLVLAAQAESTEGRIYYICDDELCDWQTMGEHLGRILGKGFKTLYIPWWLVGLAAAGGSLVSRVSPRPAWMNLDKLRDLKQPHWLCSNERARNELGFRPAFDLPTGLAASVAWYKQMGWL